MEGGGRAGPAHRRGADGRRRAADDGRRADVPVDRRPRRGGMELRRARPQQAQAGRRAAAPAARPLRPRRSAAFRTGQVVSRRAAAALGARLLLAERRRGRVAGPEPRRRGRLGLPPRRRRGAALRGGAGGAAERRSGLSRSGLRGRLVLPLARAALAGQRRSAEEQSRRRAGARPAGPRVRAGAEPRGRLRIAAAGRRGRRDRAG